MLLLKACQIIYVIAKPILLEDARMNYDGIILLHYSNALQFFSSRRDEAFNGEMREANQLKKKKSYNIMYNIINFFRRLVIK